MRHDPVSATDAGDSLAGRSKTCDCTRKSHPETAMHWFLLAAAILFETIGTTALKASDGFTRLAPTAVVVVAYGLSFWLLALVLRTIPVGIAYAIWSGLGIVFISGIGYLLFNQRLDAAALIGIALIVAGIGVINFFSNAAPH
jgi:small multidrug resistance pump